MQSIKKAKLILENGLEFEGYSFGYEQPTSGEVVFSTAMVGYPESLTDPSYSGQILVSTYPVLGNYGIPSNDKENDIEIFFESAKIHVKALIVTDYSFEYSHWNAVKSLDAWMKEEKVPGIFGIDTRELTKILRENGSMLGKIVQDCKEPETPLYNPDLENQVSGTSCCEIKRYGNGEKRVVLVDCGTKNSIIRWLLENGVEVIRVPWNHNFNTLEFDGIVISNGPGNPEFCKETVENIKTALEGNKPVCGIGMGSHLMAMAAGASVYKLKCGHRGHNQPVRMVGTNTCIITAQNHGFAIDTKSLGTDWEPLFENMNDGSCEGIRHKSKPFISAQFHPYAANVSAETSSIFNEFFKKL